MEGEDVRVGGLVSGKNEGNDEVLGEVIGGVAGEVQDSFEIESCETSSKVSPFAVAVKCFELG